MAESMWARHEVHYRGVPNALRPRHDVNLLRGGRVALIRAHDLVIRVHGLVIRAHGLVIRAHGLA